MELFLSEKHPSLQLDTTIRVNLYENLKTQYIPYNFKTPSEIYLNMSNENEKKIRYYFSKFIIKCGILLQLKQTTILTTLKILNFFYWKRTITDFEPFYIICASIDIGCKTEETIKSLNEITNLSLFLFNCEKNNYKGKITIDNYKMENFNKIKENIINIELIIMKELGYNMEFYSNHPHKYLIHFLKYINKSRDLLQKSWSCLNDMYRTSLIVNYSPNSLACAAIFLAARLNYFFLPQKVEWWKLFKVNYDDICNIVSETLLLYENNQVSLIEVKELLNHKNDKNDIKNNNNSYNNKDINNNDRNHSDRNDKYKKNYNMKKSNNDYNYYKKYYDRRDRDEYNKRDRSRERERERERSYSRNYRHRHHHHHYNYYSDKYNY